MIKQSLALLALFGICSGQALASTTVVAELGTAPLLGTSKSTAELRSRVAQNEGLLSTAAAKAGLSTAEYAQVRSAIDSSHVAWVTVPRHLDVMTWSSAGRVYAIHDVRIPAQTNGWEIDLHNGSQLIAVYMPAKCGNLSVVRKALPVIAQRPHRARVMALHAAPAPAPVVAAPLAVAPPVVAPVAAPVVAEAPAAVQPAPAASVFPPAPKRVGFFLPLIAGLIGVAIGSGGGGGSTGTPGNTPPPPTPPTTPCP